MTLGAAGKAQELMPSDLTPFPKPGAHLTESFQQPAVKPPRLKQVRHASGTMVLVLGTVLLGVAVLAVADNQWGSAAVFGALGALGAGSARLLGRRAGRSAGIDLWIVGVIFALLTVLLASKTDWVVAVVAGAIAVVAMVAGRRCVRRISSTAGRA
jgi:hypothetical protein